MPFGVFHAPATFQRLMYLLFSYILNASTIVHFNDIMIYSDTQQEYIVHLKKGILED